MATTNKQKLDKLKAKKLKLQVKLTEVMVQKEVYGKSFDGTLHNYYSMRDSKKNAHRNRLQAQINNLKKDIDVCEQKINELKKAMSIFIKNCTITKGGTRIAANCRNCV